MLDSLQTAFSNNGSKEIAKKQASYMRDLFPFMGLPSPLRREIQKPIFKLFKPTQEEQLHELATSLYALPEREYQYAAFDLLSLHKKLFTKKSFPFFENLIRTKSWLDTVDGIGPALVGNLILKERELEHVMSHWNQDKDLWIRRTSLLYQLKWKSKTSENILFTHILNLAHEKDFFIRKAIGWSLREYAKTAPDTVYRFVEEQKATLSPLSIKEALKHRTYPQNSS